MDTQHFFIKPSRGTSCHGGARKQIILTYATTIEELSTMELIMDGNKLAFDEIKIDNKQMIGTTSKPLDNGTYTIQWNIVGEDGHPIKGEINFVVQMDQGQTETPVAPDENKGKQEDNSQTTENEPNNVEQETANDTVKKADNNDTNSSSSMLFTDSDWSNRYLWNCTTSVYRKEKTLIIMGKQF